MKERKKDVLGGKGCCDGDGAGDGAEGGGLSWAAEPLAPGSMTWHIVLHQLLRVSRSPPRVRKSGTWLSSHRTPGSSAITLQRLCAPHLVAAIYRSKQHHASRSHARWRPPRPARPQRVVSSARSYNPLRCHPQYLRSGHPVLRCLFPPGPLGRPPRPGFLTFG